MSLNPDSIIGWICLVILLLPLSSFFINIFLKTRASGWIGSFILSVCFLLSVHLFFEIGEKGTYQVNFHWFSLSETVQFNWGILLNTIASILLIIVTLISLLVHIFSIEYMKGDEGINRYFALLGLFTFSMLGIVFSSNLLLLFIFWELVGFSSYLLIGFWYQKPSAVQASKKAFVVNRIGDAGFLVGILILWSQFGTLELSSLHQFMQDSYLEGQNWISLSSINGVDTTKTMDVFWLTVAGIALFCGAIGKSAQFPLQVWLPDAMEGPTPVSALIHAATMVAAGVYLLARTFFLLDLNTLTFIAFIGTVTALMGAYAALTQNDIKKVLAFSTISQLGFMMIGMGVGAYDAAVFHLVTHAFFKACLFLCAGAVIYTMHKLEHEIHHQTPDFEFDPQDMRNMGGLRKSMPVTFFAYFFSAMALAGIPLFSGLLSKDAILTGALAWATMKSSESYIYFIVPVIAFISAFLTAFYLGRQLFLVFFGKFRAANHIPFISTTSIKDVPLLMKVPLVILATLSVGMVFSLNPFDASYSWIFNNLPIPEPVTPDLQTLPNQSNLTPYLIKLHYPVLAISIFLAFLGLFAAWTIYGSGKRGSINYYQSSTSSNFWNKLSLNNWYLDKLYSRYFIVPVLSASGTMASFDKRVIDKSVEYFGIISVVLANLIAWMDKIFVDGLVRVGVYLVGKIGSFTKSFQQGSIQSHLIYTLLGALIIILLIIF